MNHTHICLACRRRLGHFRPEWLFQRQSQASFVSLAKQKSKTSIFQNGDEKHTRQMNHELPSNSKEAEGTNERLAREIRRTQNASDFATSYPNHVTYGNASQDENEGQWSISKTESHRNTLNSIGNRTLDSPDAERDSYSSIDLLSLGGAVEMRRTRNIEVKPNRGDTASSRKPSYQKSDSVLQSLFQRSINSSSPSTESSSPAFRTFEPLKKAGCLREKTVDGDSAQDLWRYFVDQFFDIAGNPIYDQKPSPYMSDTVRAMLKKVISAKANDPLSQSLPTATVVSSVCSRLNVLPGVEWCAMIFILLENISRIRQQPSQSKYQEENLVSDLVGAWNLVCRRPEKFYNRPTADSSLDWSLLPEVSVWDLASVHRKRGAPLAFGLLTPSLGHRQLEDLPLAAVATFSLLTDKQTNLQNLGDISLFISTLAQAIRTPRLDMTTTLTQVKEGAAATVAKSVVEQWPNIKARANELLHGQAYKEPTSRQPVGIIGPREANSVSGANFVIRKLRDAHANKHDGAIDKLWQDVVNWPVAKENEHGFGCLTEKLCNRFIMVYMSIQRHKSAIMVWNHMILVGLSPTLPTWNSMIDGCRNHKDWKSLEGIWAKLQNSEIQPDLQLWHTRIRALFECNQVKMGIQAFDEMGRLWLTAAKQKHPDKSLEELKKLSFVEGAEKPTLRTFNITLHGLISNQRSDATHRILTWADDFGISPNVITYNTLLAPLIRDGNSDAAKNLLQNMQDAGISADITTFTIILDEAFRNLNEHSAKEKENIIEDIFSEMEAAGLTAGLKVYAKVIQKLLSSDIQDMNAVNAVLERMTLQGIRPDAVIHTTLISYYFEMSPPNFDAIRALIERVRLELEATDHVFWDRVIEGYSRAGDTGSAMRILGRLSEDKGRTSWTSLTSLLFALGQNEEWDMARTLLKNMAAEYGGPNQLFGKGQLSHKKFWELAAELRLLQ